MPPSQFVVHVTTGQIHGACRCPALEGTRVGPAPKPIQAFTQQHEFARLLAAAPSHRAASGRPSSLSRGGVSIAPGHPPDLSVDLGALLANSSAIVPRSPPWRAAVAPCARQPVLDDYLCRVVSPCRPAVAVGPSCRRQHTIGTLRQMVCAYGVGMLDFASLQPQLARMKGPIAAPAPLVCAAFGCFLSLLSGCGLGDVGADLDAYWAAHADGGDVAASDGKTSEIQGIDSVDANTALDAEDSTITPEILDIMPDSITSEGLVDAADAATEVVSPCQPADCDDGNPCTTGTCLPAGCSQTAIDGPCPDGQACTGPDVCVAGQCQTGPESWVAAAAGESSLFSQFYAVAAEADGNWLAAGVQAQDGQGVLQPRAWLQRRTAQGKLLGNWLSPDGTAASYRLAVPLAGSVLLLGTSGDKNSFLLAINLKPGQEPPPVPQATDWPDQPAAAVLHNGGAVVASTTGSAGAPSLVIERLEDKQIWRKPLALIGDAPVRATALADAGDHLIIAGETVGLAADPVQSYVVSASWEGVKAATAIGVACATGASTHIAALLPVAGGVVAVGRCEIGGISKPWLARLDLSASQVLAQHTWSDWTGQWQAGVASAGDTLILAGKSVAVDQSSQARLVRADLVGTLAWQLLPTTTGGLEAVAASPWGWVAAGSQDKSGLWLRSNPWGGIGCSSGLCAGSDSACEDNNSCTLEACDPVSGCIHVKSTAPCDDGTLCTVADLCSGGQCQGTPLACGDGNPCTLDSCDSNKGCVHLAQDATCDDQDACTVKDVCVTGLCTAGIAISCDDDNPCTLDSCDAKVGCGHQKLGDGTGCGAGLVCAAGACITPWAKTVVAGGNFSCALLTSGSVSCWGADQVKQLGTGDATEQTVPQTVPLPGKALQIAAGSDAACALLQDGTVQCWGNNSHGMLGQVGAIALLSNSTPLAVALPQPVTQIALGDNHACALLQNQTVWCWGDNLHLQAGIVPVGTKVPPTLVGLFGQAAWLAAGSNSTCVRSQSNELKCWGSVDFVANPPADTPPLTLTIKAGASDCTIGDYHLCLRYPDGPPQCWGTNDHGQLGSGVTGKQPLAIPTETVVFAQAAKAIAAGEQFNCAADALGQLACWGDNTVGQCSTTPGVSAVAKALSVPIAAVVAVAAHDNHACAVTVTGAVGCWGDSAWPGVPTKPGAVVYVAASLP